MSSSALLPAWQYASEKRTNPNPSRCKSSLPLIRRSLPERTAASVPAKRAPGRADSRFGTSASGVFLGMPHKPSPNCTSSPRPTRPIICSRSNRRSRPPPSPNSRTSCLYPAFWPAERAILASRSRSVWGWGERAILLKGYAGIPEGVAGRGLLQLSGEPIQLLGYVSNLWGVISCTHVA